MSEYLEIRILNWEEYQEKGIKAGRKARWFKLWNCLPDRRIWDELNPTEFKFFIFLLCKVSRESHESGSVRSTIRVLSRQSCIRSGSVQKSLDRLRTCGTLEYHIVRTPVSRQLRGLDKIRKDKRRVEGTENSKNPNIEPPADHHPPIPSLPKLNGSIAPEPASKFFTDLLLRFSGSPLKARTSLGLRPKEQAHASTLLQTFPDRDYWVAVMRRAEQSPYLCNQTDRPFRFNLAFLLHPLTHQKIMHGDYDAPGLSRRDIVRWEEAKDEC